jgi:hypothetical protein
VKFVSNSAAHLLLFTDVMNDRNALADAFEQKWNWAHMLKLVFLPYLGLGMSITTGVMGPRGFTTGLLWIVGIGALVLGSFWVTAIILSGGGKRFLGMDRGLWIFAVLMSLAAGAGVVYIGMKS